MALFIVKKESVVSGVVSVGWKTNALEFFIVSSFVVMLPEGISSLK